MVDWVRTKVVMILRWSEKYTKTDMVYLAKGGLWMSGSQVVAGVASLLLAMAFANLVSKETYGSYKYILSLAATIGALSLSGIGTAITQSVGRGLEGMLKHAFWANLRWSIPMIALTLGAAAYYGYNKNYELALSLVVIAAFEPILNSVQFYVSFLTGKRDFMRAAVYGATTTIVQAGCLFVALWFGANVPFLILIYFASLTGITSALYLRTVSHYKPNSEFNAEMYSFGSKMSMLNIASALVGQLDKILIFHFLGAAPVAIFALAQAPVVQMRAILKMSTPLALPKLAAQDKDTLLNSLSHKVTVFTLGILGMVVMYAIAAPFLFHIFFPKYPEAVLYSQMYALLLLLFPKKLISLTLFAQEYQKGMYTLSMVAPVIQTVLLLVLVPTIGIWGAIVAEIIGSLISNIYANYCLEQFKKI
jgi:O-antigen/teichoic acid export membrane protein